MLHHENDCFATRFETLKRMTYIYLRSSTNRKHFLAFVYVCSGAFAISNGVFAVGNESVIEVQTRMLFWDVTVAF